MATYRIQEHRFNGTDYDNIVPVVAMLTGASDPTPSTEGVVSQWYMNITTNKVFRCLAVNGNVYTWEALSAGLLPEIVVTAPTGSSLTCTDGVTTLTGDVIGTSYTFEIPNFGTWTVTATLGSKTASGEVVVDVAQVYELTLQYAAIYGVRIDTQNSDPFTALTYTDNAVGIVPSTGWDNTFPFNQIKPCVLSNGGTVNYYLNPNNFNQKADGSPADITSGNDGDVMIEFPRCAYSIAYDSTNRYLDVKITNYSSTELEFTYGGYNFTNIAFARGTTVKDKLYIGAYDGYYDGNYLTSLSGQLPTVSQTIGTFINYANQHGNGYDILGFYPLTFLQVLYIIRYKNLNSQQAIGLGYTNASSAIASGQNNTNGMYYGTTSSTQPVSFAGIENFWGNVYQWIGGLYCDGNHNILTTTQNFNDTGSGYNSYSSGLSSNISGYMTKSQGSNDTGFVIKADGGSSSTYYCDHAILSASRLPSFGGYWRSDLIAGAFQLYVSNSGYNTDSSVGSRLMFL